MQLRLQLDLANALALLQVPFKACEEVSTKVSSQSLVRYRCNDYSVPIEYTYQTVRVKGYVDRVIIA
ncbi:Mu transposase domain-containing protein [Acinetobacter venetianus]|uniref:Mu transposase domain-containing protein n=1 Tax=Acinetobacter venetianus TaxID=52133 RepID=UPI003C77A9F1